MRVQVTLFSYGGVHGHTFDSFVDELAFAADAGVEVYVGHVGEDALISRSRSTAATKFLQTPCDVLCMVDHDIQWNAGDLLHIAKVACEKQAIVGGLYACRSFHGGHASRLKGAVSDFVVGDDKLYEAEYVAGGFCAVHRSVYEEIAKGGKVQKCLVNLQGEWFYDFYRPLTVPSTVVPGAFEYVSEDWSLSRRAHAIGKPSFVSSKPVLRHYGSYGFRVQDGLPECRTGDR